MNVFLNQWHSFVIKFVADPFENGDGDIVVWMNGSEKPVAQRKGPFRFSKTCVDEQHFRIKWGIYKANEPGKYSELNSANVLVGTTFDDVRQWEKSKANEL